MSISRPESGFLDSHRSGSDPSGVAQNSCCSHPHESAAGSEPVNFVPAIESLAVESVVQTTPATGFFDKAVRSLDNLGIVASTLCLIHCLALPFAVAFLPFLGLQCFHGHEAHLWMGAFVWAFALFGLVPGYIKHRKPVVLAGMVVGLGLVTFAILFAEPMLGEQYELPFIVTGNLILVAIHWWNRGMFNKKCCDHTH